MMAAIIIPYLVFGEDVRKQCLAVKFRFWCSERDSLVESVYGVTNLHGV